MDYEAIDRYCRQRDMSSWVVTTVKNGVRFYISTTLLATDIPARAQRWRYYGQAESAANAARQDYAWQGFHWEVMSVPEMLENRR